MLGLKSNKAVFLYFNKFCVRIMFSFSLQFVSSKPLILFISFVRFFVFCLIMTDFKVCSLNVLGLGEQLKRREFFNWLKITQSLSTPGNS